MQKRIACIDLDAFFVEAALKINPGLRGYPVAVGRNGNRSVICSASYEARKFGIKSAMPTWQALARCPKLVILPVPDNIVSLSEAVRHKLEQLCPIVEPASIDEFYLDFTGCDRIYPTNLEIGDRIIAELQRDPGFGTIGFATTSWQANRFKSRQTRGILEIIPERKSLLASLQSEIPGIGRKTLPLLNSMAIYHIRTFFRCRLRHGSSIRQIGEYIYHAASGSQKAELSGIRKTLAQKRFTRHDPE